MGDMPDAYPLAWPAGRPRTPANQRKRATFGRRGDNGWVDLTVAVARERLMDELRRLGARWPIVSSNLELRRDGLPYSGRPEPTDPGVAVYFQLDGKPICMPCDRYDRVADNIAAVAAHIEATRAIERHGVGTAAEALMAFQALPAPGKRHWREVLGFSQGQVATAGDIRAAYIVAAKRAHPDNGGSDSWMAEVNAARDQALKDVGA